MNWVGKKVLVTGAGGFIGSHLTERLVELGASTRAFVQYNSKGSWGWLDSSPVKEDVEIVQGDLVDGDFVRHAVKGIDVVFHLGALIGIPYSYLAPMSYVRTNVEGTVNVIQAALDFDVEKVVHTSTSEVYGTAQYVPIDEKHPTMGQSPYSASKIAADKMVESYHRSFGLPAVTVRPFNTYGPRQSARAIIPTIISQALALENGRLGNLDPTRDLNFVDDTAEGFVKAAESDEAVGMTINLGTGKEISIGDLATKIADLMNSPIKIISDNVRIRPEASEVERLCADNTLAKRVLGWEPQNTLDEGLIKTIAWIKENSHHFKAEVYAV